MLTLPIKTDSSLHRHLVNELSSRIKWAKQGQKPSHETWRKAEETLNAFVPETVADGRRRAKRDSGDPQVTTMVLPYSFAVVMAAHTYFTSVLLGRSPVHQLVGLSGEPHNKVQACEALLQYQVSQGALMLPYYSWLYDAARMGHGVIKTAWEKQVRTIATIIEEVAPQDDLFSGAAAPGPTRSLRIEDVEVYEGNKVTNVSVFDFLPDPRVSLQNFQDGEFCAHRISSMSWNTVKERERQGFYTNTERLTKSSGSIEGYQGDSSRPMPSDFKMDITEGSSSRTNPETINVFEVYIHAVPSQLKIGDRERPELWCFTITEDFSIILGATPLGYYHAKFPFSVAKIDPNCYTMDSRGFPKMLEGVQNTMDWMLNTHLFNIRAMLQNLFVVDPSRVRLADLEDPLPGGIIRIRAEAAGMDVRTAVHQVPIADVTRQHLSELPMMQGIGERIAGVNDSVIGALEGGSRKTATEVRTTTGFSVNRLKTMTEFLSHGAMGPHALMMLQNSQQFYKATKKLRIAGDTMQFAGSMLDVTPETIAGGYEFVHVDGTMPADRLAEAKLMQELMTQMTAFPQLGMQYDLGRMLMWAVQRAGLKNTEQFKIQTMPDAQVAQQQQAGNLVPVPPRTSASRGTPQLGNSAGATGPIV